EIPSEALRAVVEEIAAEHVSTAPLRTGTRALVIDDGSGVAPVLAERLSRDGLDVSVVEAGSDATEAARAADAVIAIDLRDRGAPEVFDALAPAALADAQWLGCVTVIDAVGGQPGFIRALHAELPDRAVRCLQVPPDIAPDTVAGWAHEEL